MEASGGKSGTGFAVRLRELRRGRKCLQAEVAEAVGVSRPYLAGLEGGHDVPGREVALALASYFDVSVDWLLTGAGGQVRPAAAETEQEAQLLAAFRKLPEDEAAPLLAMLVSRLRK